MLVTNVAPRIAGRVLCVEDDNVSYLLVAAVLQAHLPNVALLRASTAAEGVQLARSYKPDVILLDLHLPDRPGLEVIRELNSEISSGVFDVLVVTADKLGADQIKARALGALDVLLKPIHVNQFRDLLAATLARRNEVPRSTPAAGL